MPYTTNPYAPRARREAINLVIRDGYTKSQAARKTGVHRSTIGRWLQKSKDLRLHRNALVPTLKSAPKQHPNRLADWIVAAVVTARTRHDRCALVVYEELRRNNIPISLSSVKRTLKRERLTRPRSKWARYRPHVHRPLPNEPGTLVQIDTVHFYDYRPTNNSPYFSPKNKFYLYTIIDLHSRWAYAEYHTSINQKQSLEFTLRAQREFSRVSGGQTFSMIQADNGQEFGRYFNDQLQANGIALRHSRVRRSNDNAHIERFNRTIQEEGFKTKYPSPVTVKERLTPFLEYYNNARMHLGINCCTPLEMLRRC